MWEMLDSEILDEMSCMAGKMRDALRQVGNGKFLGWADHSGSKWRRGSARITDHKFQARQGAAKRDGRWVGGMAPSSYPYSIGGIGVDGVPFQSICPPKPPQRR